MLFNVPAVTDLPYFTTIPYNSLDWEQLEEDGLFGDLDAETVVGIANTAYEAYNTALDTALLYGYIDTDEHTSRYISFDATAIDPVVIEDENLTDLEAINVLFTGAGKWRLATENDLINLTAGSILGTQAVTGELATTYGIGVPLGDEFVLTPEEQELISEATTSYNTTIAALATADANLMLFDANTLLTTLKDSGITSEGTTVTGDISLTGAFSLDGIHLNPRGNAVFANMVIEDINDYFGSTLQLHDPIYFSTLTFK